MHCTQLGLFCSGSDRKADAGIGANFSGFNTPTCLERIRRIGPPWLDKRDTRSACRVPASNGRLERLCRLARLRWRVSRGAWLFSSCCGSFPTLDCYFNRRWQIQRGLFLRPMVAMMPRLDARSFFFHPQLSVSTFLAIVLKVCRNRFSCHGRSVAELSPSKLSNLGHSATIRGRYEEAVLRTLAQSFMSTSDIGGAARSFGRSHRCCPAANGSHPTAARRDESCSVTTQLRK